MRSMPIRSDLSLAASYERLVPFSLATIWEVLFDWERLSTMHNDLFGTVQLVDKLRKTWCVETHCNQPDRRHRQVLRFVPDQERSHFRLITEAGPGAGSEVRVRFTQTDSGQKLVSIKFYVDEMSPHRRAELGAKLVANSKVMWERDEELMRHLTSVKALGDALANAALTTKLPKQLVLGPLHEVRARAPFTVVFGDVPYRIYCDDGVLAAHAALCPHRKGPLHFAGPGTNTLVCSWHGRRFRASDGECTSMNAASIITPPPKIAIRRGQAIMMAQPRTRAALPDAGRDHLMALFVRSRVMQPEDAMSASGVLTR